MIITVSTSEKDGGTSVQAIRFSHPTPDVPTSAPVDPAEAQELAPVLFLAPAGLPDNEQEEPEDRYPSRRPPIGEARHQRRSPRSTH